MSNPLPTADAQGCPWQELAEYGAPNVKWCEERLCAWVNEPANAWSNITYFIVAALIFYLQRNDMARRETLLRCFAPVLAIVGTCSFVYHASNVYVTQILDFFGMYLFCFLLLLWNLVRLGALPISRFALAFVGCVTTTTTLTAVVVRYRFPVQTFVVLLGVATVGTELAIYRRRRAASPYALHALFGSLGLLLAAGVFSALDVTRAWCDPKDHALQGHAMWHVLSAFSLGLAYCHYRQLGRVRQDAGVSLPSPPFRRCSSIPHPHAMSSARGVPGARRRAR